MTGLSRHLDVFIKRRLRGNRPLSTLIAERAGLFLSREGSDTREFDVLPQDCQDK
jgi:hypothetical protein